MWKKQKKKRFFKSFICMVLAILLFVTNVPNLELVLKVMANPKPDRLTVEDKEEKAEHGSFDSEIKTETEITSLEKNTESAKENNLGQETGLGVTPMPDYVEMQSEPEQSADGMNMEETNHLNDNHSDYVKTVLPEDIVYDEIIEGDAILSDWIEIRDKKILYLGDVTINDFVKISNSTIRVSGQIILQSGGELQMENSTIWTDGDFRLTGGGIKGRQENVLVVMGGFYTQHSWDIPLGLTLELHGNFYHIEGSLNTKKSDWGQIVFAGEEEQHVSMGDGNLRNIVVSNREGKIHADTPLRGLELTHDTVIAGDEVVVTGNGNGYKLTIEGNFLGKGFNLNDSSHLYVQGEYRIQEIEGMEVVNYIPGIVSSGEAQIVVDKDFRIQKKDEDGNYGVTGEFLEPVISGSLRVVVKGDFYTQSVTVSNSISPEMTLEVYGDIHHVGNSYFRNKGLIVFAEKDEHHVSMGGKIGTLGKLQILNNEGRIYADTPLWGLELTQDTVIAATEVVVNGRGNGHKLTIEGDFLLGPNYMLNDGALLHIKGDLRVQEVTGELPVGLESSGMAQVIVDKDLRVQKKDENGNYGEISGGLFMDVTGQLKIVVKGDFYCQSTSSRAQIHEGVILELHGDFNLLGKYSVFSSTKGRVVFAGDSEQHIFMESVWGELKNITQNKSCPSLVFNCSDGTVTLAGDIIIKNSSNIHKLGLNGNTADIQGSANITGSIGGGSLKCSGDLTVTGVLSPYKGILNIGGDLYLEDEGKINMSYDEGIIVINGTLYNNSDKNQIMERGLLDIKKDFIQTTTSRFTTSQNAFAQISGSYHHNVKFPPKAYVWFYNLGIDAGLDYTFTVKPIWNQLFRVVDTGKITEQIAAKYFGEPGVSPATGNYSQGFSDMTVQSILGPLEITHSYNSMSEETGVLGKGFAFSQNINIKSENILGTDQKTIFMPDGSRCVFLKHSNGSYEAQDSRNELVEENGNFILETQDNAKYNFDGDGRIQYMEDKAGNRMLYTVDENGRTVLMQDDTGTYVTFHYKNDLLSRINNEETGETAWFEYADGKLSKFVDADGKSTGYEYNENGLLSKIVNNDGSTFEEITYMNGGKHDKKVETVKNMVGNVDTYQYDDVLPRTTITDSNGRTVRKEFDFNYYLTSSTNALGETVRTTYNLEGGMNKFGEVVSEIDSYNNTTSYARDAKGRVTKVTYPDGSTELTTYDMQNNITKSVDRKGSATFYIYDSTGKYLMKQATPLNGSKVYQEGVDENAFAITTYSYDMENIVKGLIRTETTPLGDEKNYKEYARNQKGQILAMTVYMDGEGYETTYQYNDKWFPITESAPDGVITKYDYNKFNELIRKSVTSPDGKQKAQERFVYDQMGHKIIEAGALSYDQSADDLAEDSYTGSGTHYTYNMAGQITTQTDASGNKTIYEYDLYGNVLKERYPDGTHMEYTYDAMDRKTSTVFYNSMGSDGILLEEYSYRRSGNNLLTITSVYLDESRTAVSSQITDFAGRVIKETDAVGNTVSKTYTKDGQIATETDSNGRTTIYTYDRMGNLSSRKSPFDGSDYAKETYTYDKAGNILQKRVNNDPAGVISSLVSETKTSYEYDTWGNLVKTIQYDDENPVNYIQCFYDFKGRLLREYKGLSKPLSISGLDQVHSNGDDEYTVTKYEYNYQDMVVKMIDSAGQIEISTYDSAGNLLQTQEQDGGTYQTVYDILGQKTEESKSFPGKKTITKTFSYDSMGRLINTTENNETVTFTYNDLGQMIQEKDGIICKEYEYDYTGAVLSMKISDNTENLRYTQNTYDLLGRLISVNEDGNLKASYTYDRMSRLLTTKYQNGITETNVYNDAGLPKSVVNKDAAGKIISGYQYTYAVDGNQLSKTDAGGTTSYKYDGLNRLIEETHTNTGKVETTNYIYDENGNRIRMEKRTCNGLKWEEYTYDKLDHLLTKSTPDGITEYTYDQAGNQLTKSSGSRNEIQTYDALNRLISWTDGSEKAEYTYYPDNNRATKTVNGVKTRHIWSGGEIQVDITEGKTVEYIHGHRLIESSYGTYLYNAHGDVVQLVKDNQVAERYDYDAYGNPKEEKSREKKTADKPEDSQSNSNHTDQNPYRYTGEYRDEETGYIYLRARYYDVRLGRFLNTDPAKQGTNWYAYAGGNPVLYHDPSGLFFSEAWEGIKNTGRNLVSGAQSVGRAIGSAASAAGKMVKEFTSTTVGKVVVGATVIAVAAVATVVTGGAAAGLAGAIASGALTGAIAGAASGAAIGGVSGVISNRISTGSWEGSGQALVDGAASGFMQGSIAGAVGGAVSGGIRYGTNALAGKLANPNSRPNSTYGQGRPTQGQGYSKNGYNPKPGERTIEGYVKNNVSPNAETKLFTKSAGFNNSKETTGGLFKMFGSNSHGGISPHVHQPKWNMNPNTGKTFGGIFKTSTGPGLIDSPNTQDIKHLYQYLVNGMYH